MIICSSVSDTEIEMHLSTFFKLENLKRDELWGVSGRSWFQSFQLFLERVGLKEPKSMSTPNRSFISSIKTICIIFFFTWRSNEIFFSLLQGCIVPICLAWRVLAPNIWSLTAVKANCRAKGKLFMFLISAPPLIFHFSQLSGLFRVQEQFTCL